ncbi:MAG: ATP-binding cassette domain-containing protein [Pirellulaceae bacterium]|nr:ATP-binding cassette domain-containing protein [Pirellulaceae bacterium]
MHPIIRLVDVHKAFDRLNVLNGVSLDLYEGETTVIVGPSGTGKSVLLKHMIGLTRPDRGEVYFKNRRIDRLSEAQLVDVRCQMGMLFQTAALFDSMTVEENVTFPLVEHTKMTPAERLQRCEKVLKIVGLYGIGRSMPAQLSGGQRKRVALARAVVLEPQVVLYDEPTTGLDPIRADVINELIKNLAQRTGITSVVVTHDMASANKIADRMVMLYDGVVAADATPQAFGQSEEDMVQRFIHGRADRGDLELIRDGFEPAHRGSDRHRAAP